jgi:hypothetical protein
VDPLGQLVPLSAGLYDGRKGLHAGSELAFPSPQPARALAELIGLSGMPRRDLSPQPPVLVELALARLDRLLLSSDRVAQADFRAPDALLPLRQVGLALRPSPLALLALGHGRILGSGCCVYGIEATRETDDR